MKRLKDLREWMEWKGISTKDLLSVTVTMGFLFSVTVIFLWAMIESLT